MSSTVGSGSRSPASCSSVKLVEWLVLVERFDHVVAEWIDADGLVAVIADAVGIADQVEPPHRHPLAEFGRSQQAIDNPFVGPIAWVGRERIHLGNRRRQTGEVESQPPHQRNRVSLRRGGEMMLAQRLQDELVDRAFGREARIDGRRLGAADRQKGPVTLPLRALLDPPAEHLPIDVGKPLGEGGRRHALLGRVGADPPPEFAVVGLAGHHDAGFAGFAKQAVPRVETQIGFALVLVGAVASVAAVREDGPDVPVEFDHRGHAGLRRRRPAQHRARAQGGNRAQPAQQNGRSEEACVHGRCERALVRGNRGEAWRGMAPHKRHIHPTRPARPSPVWASIRQHTI